VNLTPGLTGYTVNSNRFASYSCIVHLLYMNAFDGKFHFILKDKKPTSLAQAKEYSAEIEENLLDSKVDPFQYPRVKAEAKTKASSSSAPDPISLLTQKIDQMSTQFVQAQNQIMGRFDYCGKKSICLPDLSLPDNREMPQVGNQGLNKRQRPLIL
jgi:hypothetical protein